MLLKITTVRSLIKVVCLEFVIFLMDTQRKIDSLHPTDCFFFHYCIFNTFWLKEKELTISKRDKIEN